MKFSLVGETAYTEANYLNVGDAFVCIDVNNKWYGQVMVRADKSDVQDASEITVYRFKHGTIEIGFIDKNTKVRRVTIEGVDYSYKN